MATKKRKDKQSGDKENVGSELSPWPNYIEVNKNHSAVIYI